MTNPQKPTTQSSHYPIFVLTAIGLTLFLFFIDEGNYNFAWMTQWGNWVVFVIYLGLLIAFQMMTGWIVTKFYPVKSNLAWVVLSSGIGFILSLSLLFFIYS